MTFWASTRECYPLSVMLGTTGGLAVAFVALYAHESPLWVVGLQMLLCAVLGPQALVFLSARLIGCGVGRRPWSAAAGAR